MGMGEFGVVKLEVCLLLLMVVLAGCGSTESTFVATNSNAGTASFREPAVVRSQDGVLNTSLEMKRTLNSIGTRTVATNTYNGGIPGPTWRVKPGDTLRFRVTNNMTPPISASALQRSLELGERAIPEEWCLPTSTTPSAQSTFDLFGFQRAAMQMDPESVLVTNIHTHGLQVDPRGNGDNPFITITPGQYKDYEIKIPEDHPSGLFWYHPHVHMTTSRQGWNGLAGAIIVEGGLDDHPDISQMKERLMIVNELILDHNGQVPFGVVVPVAGFVPFSTVPTEPLDICFPINGVDQPNIDIQPGEVQRWRFLNASPHRAMELSLEGHSIYQIAQDGIHFETPKQRETLVVAAGNRVEFLVQGGPEGVYRFSALPRDQGHPGGARPKRILGRLVSSGQEQTQSIPQTLLPSPEPDISQNPIATQRAIRFKGGILSAPVEFFLNDLQFDAERIDNTVAAGDTDEWTLVNEDVFEHPFHIHVNPFQVVEVNGEPYPEPEVWWDTFYLPARGTVKVRMRYREDVVGKTVYHCHILPHEDNGMMSAFEITEPGGGFPDLQVDGPFSNQEVGPIPPVASQGGNFERPYIFTQASNGLTAEVDADGRVQLQLPGDPNTWTLLPLNSDSITLENSTVIPSPGRIPGLNSIYQFDFRMTGTGPVTINLVADPPVSWLPNPFELLLITPQ